ncbi:putative MFS family arabinose efflux permease [Sediminihabitans luteus]|uniref:Putative MFS family arabinose efflux permease n=1 Tax=Sediminihabitans luteus TaxID=1138585 RepID=A0A2M9D183_9CELL|nr:MFS transporter [Sediminihabitans luteus]PJJ77887.1 putative MFS family arabinose efflux permease [Sediminihabitans luteus]GII99755.1 MFS transporter [Sediminihabitans luteus]
MSTDRPTPAAPSDTAPSDTVPSDPTPAAPSDSVPSDSVAPDPQAALRTRPFRLLTAAWACTNLADSVLVIILAVWVKDLTGSDGQAALVFAALGAPALVAPLLGHLADRVSRRRMMVVTYLAGALTLASLFAVQDAGQLWLVYLVTVVYSTVGFATASAQSGLVRDMLPDAALGRANGRLTTIDQVFRLAMPVIGAAIYAVAGPRPLVAAAAVAFVAAAALIGRVALVETPPTPSDEREAFWTEAAAGFRHLLRTAPLGAMTIALAVAFGGVGLLNAVSFAIIDQGLGLEPELLGPISSVQAVTAIVAGLTAGRLVERWGAPRLVVVALGVVALGVLPTLGTSVVGVLLGLGLVGLGITWAIVGFVTERQLLTPARLQGRTSAATNLLLNVPQLVLTLVGAAVVGAVDYRLLVALTAVGVLAGAAVAAPAALRRASRTTPR